jgi:thiamine-monophosphate kinase
VKLKDIGERNLIHGIFKDFKISQQKDDCAIIDNGDEVLLLSTDIIRESTHIPKGAKPRQIGKFAANINLSDIAAMAGQPVGMLVSYLLSPEMEEAKFREIVSGVNDALKAFDAEILGGDTKEGEETVISGTVLGKQQKSIVRRRADISKGQILGVTHNLGRAASGYLFQKHGYQKSRATDLILDITPRIREAQAISRNGGKFMMDLSDGLFSSISQMKDDYGLGFRIVEDELPSDRNVKKASDLSGISATEIMGGFGGEYELLFTVENQHYKSFMEAMESEGVKVSFIGDVWEGKNIIYNGKNWADITNRGYEHFSKRPFS